LTDADLAEPASPELTDFAHTFDGYRHFGGLEAAIARMEGVRRRWEAEGTLPDEVDDLRVCLFLECRPERFVEMDDLVKISNADGTVVHEADPSLTTPARRAQKRYKRAPRTKPSTS